MAGKGQNGAFCTLLAYKDSRVDMAVLDSLDTPWSNEYKRDSKGVLQCGISIWVEELGQWVTRWSNGVESNTEKQKGEYSDAFKRAGFMWGISRELYDMPSCFVNLDEKEYKMQGDKVKVGRLYPNDWQWELDIARGYVVGKHKGVVRVSVGKSAPPKPPASKPPLKEPSVPPPAKKPSFADKIKAKLKSGTQQEKMEFAALCALAMAAGVDNATIAKWKDQREAASSKNDTTTKLQAVYEAAK